MTTPETLKRLLVQVKRDGYRAPQDHDFDSVVADMLRFIGHQDPELRDSLIYATFCQWSLQGVLSADQFRRIVAIGLDDQHLFYRIGETDTDSVFTRSFSVLLVPLILTMDRERPFLSGAEVSGIKETVLEYIRRERDFRGYVEGKGWAHAMAHAADALDDIARHPATGPYGLHQVLSALAEMAANRDATYVGDEDERIATAVLAVYERKMLPDYDLHEWVRGFRPARKGVEPGDSHLSINQRNLLRSLYFKLLSQPAAEQLESV